jgi:GNAT superfamily N-acetyltransferase
VRRSSSRRGCPSTPTDVGADVDTDALDFRSLAADPAVADDLAALEEEGPRFLVESTATARRHLDEVAAETTWVGRGRDGETLVAVRAVRLRWDGSVDDAPAGGLLEAVARAEEDDADTLAILDVRVRTVARGGGLGRATLARSSALAREAGCQRTLVLLRTHAKVEHPLTPYVRYLASTRPDGHPFDPWLRQAWTVGLRPVRGVDRSLIASAPLERWSSWAGRAFPTSGPELVPGAIKPAIVEFERGEGRYREPHLWAATERDLADPPPAGSGWVRSLAHVGLVPGDRTHREVVRRR